MAKKSLRVFEIAKELGVASKEIVEKCKAEDVPGITNHMSTVKLGLAETIREWFSDDHHVVTAVESTEHVDLEKAKKARRRRAKKKADSEAEAGEATTGTATAEMEPPAATQAAPSETAAPKAAKRRTRPAPTAEAPTPVEEAGPVEEAAPAAPEDERVAAQAQEAVAAEAEEQAEAGTDVGAEKPSGPIGVPNVPAVPKEVKPAGEQLQKPQSVKLKGPQVVRIEKPDEIAKPRARRAPGGGGPAFDVPDTGPGIRRSGGPVRGRGAGAGPAPEETDPRRRGGPNKRRSLTSRRGRYAESLPTGPTKFTEADLAELDARLNRATGFVKQRRQSMRKREGGQVASPAIATGGRVEIQEPIFIKDLSAATGIKGADIVKHLFKQGIMASINSSIDAPVATEVCMEYDIELVVKAQETAEQQVVASFASREQIDVRPRPPVVTVLGHVDHGKTSLLDRIRAADVAAHEDGGITQHIGAYRVTIQGHDEEEKTVVFLDTPGHEAFTSMRARGAEVTDIAVVVVAADDGVMPQTVESINHAQAAGVPVVVALNKTDLPQATNENIQRILGQLAEHGLNPVEWGGETEVIRTSAETGDGITELLEILDYQAELLELKADYQGAATGTVIEAEMQEGRGPVARALVQQGRVAVGDFIVIGRAYGRVRDMTDDRGRQVREVGPATPIELSGIDRVPDAGNQFYVTDTLRKAEDVAMQYREIEREQQLARNSKVTLDNLAEQIQAGVTKELRVVLKADVQGSVDVLTKSLEKLGNEEVAIRVLHAGVGGISESDIDLADASEAIIVGFHVNATTAVREIAEARGVEIRLYRVIYDLTDELKQGLEGMLTPDIKEDEIGRAEVRQVFRVSKIGMVAGCLVTEGSMQRTGKVRVVRDGVVVTEGRDMDSLRRVKDDVREVRAGTECGIRVTGFDDVKPDDVIVCYNVVEVRRKLD